MELWAASKGIKWLFTDRFGKIYELYQAVRKLVIIYIFIRGVYYHSVYKCEGKGRFEYLPLSRSVMKNR